MTFSPPAPPAFADCTPRQRAARVVSDGLAPANMVVALLLLVGWHAGASWTGLGWGLFAALFCGAGPIGIIAFGVRRGALTDQHIRAGSGSSRWPWAWSAWSPGSPCCASSEPPARCSRSSSRCSWAWCRPCW
ncbi:hypothetical protein ACFXGI_11620 [Streptomyces sp. NPDC059355]|uniref:hypothetical protein n=1 Tax=Streptomyces sp. NPDC059355 TaxID=3346811 RepID=UPI0036B1E0F4